MKMNNGSPDYNPNSVSGTNHPNRSAPPQSVRSQHTETSEPSQFPAAYTTNAPPLPDDYPVGHSYHEPPQPEFRTPPVDSSQPVDAPLNASQLRSGVAIIMAIVFVITSAAVVALVTLRVWQDRDALFAEGVVPENKARRPKQPVLDGNNRPNQRTDIQPQLAAKNSKLPKIQTSAGFKSFTWRHNNQMVHFEYISQGDLVSDLKLIVRETKGNAEFPASIADACQRLENLKVGDIKQSIERTLVFAWLAHQPPKEEYRQTIAQQLVTSRKKFPFYRSVVVQCFLQWGTNDLAPEVWDSALRNEGTLLADLAERFPSQRMLELLKASSASSRSLRRAWLNMLKQVPPADPLDIPSGLSSQEIQQLYQSWGLNDHSIQQLKRIKNRDFASLQNEDLPQELWPKIRAAIRNPRPRSNQEAWWICLARFGDAEDLGFLKTEAGELTKNPLWSRHAIELAVRNESHSADENVIHMLEAFAKEHKNQMRARTLSWEQMDFQVPELSGLLAESGRLKTAVSQHAASNVGSFGNGDFWLATALECDLPEEDLHSAIREFADGEAGLNVLLFDRLIQHLTPNDPATGRILGKLIATEYGRQQIDRWADSMSKLTEVPPKASLEAAIEPFLLHSNRKTELRKLWSCFGKQLEPCGVPPFSVPRVIRVGFS